MESDKPTMANTGGSDRIAIATSALCIVHCLALPLLALTLPILGVVAEWELAHWTFAIVAIAASASVPFRDSRARTVSFLLHAGVGIFLLVAGLFAEHFSLDETLLTVAGGIVLAGLHLLRLRDAHYHQSRA